MYKMLTTEQRNKLKNLIIDRVMSNPMFYLTLII